jgi:hypothetical protein
MLRIIDDLPETVLGVEAVGKVTADDYRDVLVPAVEARIARFAKVRLLYVLGSGFEGFSGGAAWQDAMLGMRHLTAFERVAVVTDSDWLAGAIRAFGFAMPAEVRTFDGDELDEARGWIVDPASPGKLEFTLDEEAGILVLRPQDELERGDFERVAAAVDPVIERRGSLAGIAVVAPEFPGWDDFAALIAHLKFVREHHARVRRIALVTSSRFLSVLPRLAKLFVHAELRRFESDQEDEAMAWIRGG